MKRLFNGVVILLVIVGILSTTGQLNLIGVVITAIINLIATGIQVIGKLIGFGLQNHLFPT